MITNSIMINIVYWIFFNVWIAKCDPILFTFRCARKLRNQLTLILRQPLTILIVGNTRDVGKPITITRVHYIALTGVLFAK